MKAGDKQWCRGWAEINHKIRKRWREVKRERGRGEDEEARSWEPYTYLLKWGIRVEEVEFPTEWGRGGVLQHGSHTHHLYLSKLIPRQAIWTHTQTMLHLGIPRMHITQHIHIYSHTSTTTTTTITTTTTHTPLLNLALWLYALSLCSFRPVECFTGALGPNTHTLRSKVGW